jgi:phage protein D
MVSLGGLLDPGSRQPPSCLIEVGEGPEDIGDIAALVASVEVQTGREETWSGAVVIEDRRREDGQWMAADSGLFTRWAPIRISADFQTHQEEIIRGYITGITPEYGTSPADAKLTLEVQDAGAALGREQMRRVWGNDAPITDLLILTELVADLDLAPDPASAQGQSSRALAQEATPIQFLQERARANGFELMFDAGLVYFGPRRLDGTAQAPILVYAGRSTNCRSFTLSDKTDNADAVRVDIAPREAGAEAEPRTFTPDETLLGTTPTAAEGAGLGAPSVWRLGREGDETPEETSARALALVNAHAFKVHGAGELDGSLYGHVLKPGRLVTIDGTGTRYGGLYYVDKVSHSFNTDGYTQGFELMRNATGDGSADAGPLSAVGSAIGGLFAGAGFTGAMG